MFSIREKSLYVAALDLWVDSMRSRERCYVSHGHADHARRHTTIVTSKNNARVCRLRLGVRTEREGERQSELFAPAKRRQAPCAFEEHGYNEPWEIEGHRLTLFPAGHVLGSAQLAIDGERGRFVYTGDFKLEPSYTAEAPEVKRCDVLLMECTYGRPQYVFPPRAEVAGAMVAWARRALADGATPLFYAYSLGKAQEALAILGNAGIPVTAHGAVFAMTRVYEEAGIVMPPYEEYDPETFDGARALVWPPSGHAPARGARRRPVRTAALTGWVASAGTRGFGGRTDAGFPLSDHADYPSLLRYLELAQPRRVILNHGYRDFTERVRKLGFEAEYLEENGQLALF
jgi:Cft2 family RNA processing exonuclease